MKNTSNSVLDFAVPVRARGMSALVAIGRNLLVNETKFVRSKEEEGGEADRSPSMLLTTHYSPLTPYLTERPRQRPLLQPPSISLAVSGDSTQEGARCAL